MNMGLKEFLRNDSVDVRRSAAGNPNTPGAVLAELAKDSDNDVRSSAAGNPKYIRCRVGRIRQRIQIGA